MATYGPYYFGVGSGNATSPASPDATNAPSLASNGRGFAGGLVSGPNTSLPGMLSNGLTGNPLTQSNPGLLSGNFTGEGALNSGKALAGQMLSGMIPGLGPANMLTTLLGPLAQALTNIGQFGQQTTPELNGEIGLGLGLSGTGPNVNANVANAIAQGIFGGMQSGRGDSGQPSGPPGVPGVGEAGLSDGGMGGVGNAAGGNPGDEDKGGMIGVKRFPSSGDGKHVQVKALPTEFVVNPKAAKLHRDVLTAINSGATRAQLAGILKGGGSRATR